MEHQNGASLHNEVANSPRLAKTGTVPTIGPTKKFGAPRPRDRFCADAGASKATLIRKITRPILGAQCARIRNRNRVGCLKFQNDFEAVGTGARFETQMLRTVEVESNCDEKRIHGKNHLKEVLCEK